MGFPAYRQNDPVRYNHPYCPGGVMGTHGCGPTACGILLKTEPMKIADWLTNHGYASSAYGTDHDGINAVIKAYGHKSWYSGQSLNGVMNSGYFDKLLQHMADGKTAVLLMGGQETRCRTSYWCSAGHYVSAVGIKNNRIQIIDPAYAPRDGYHPMYGYSADDLNGNIKYIYLTDITWKDEPVDTSYKFTPANLYIGVKGASKWVKLCQRILKAREFYKGKIDGSYQEETEKAVKEYQKARGLKQDGNCGANTWTDLLGITGTPKVLREIKNEMTGNDVYLWQEILKSAGYYNGKLDRSFGGGTYAATVKYQKEKGLTANGVVGKKTWTKAIG